MKKISHIQGNCVKYFYNLHNCYQLIKISTDPYFIYAAKLDKHVATPLRLCGDSSVLENTLCRSLETLQNVSLRDVWCVVVFGLPRCF